MQHVLRAGRQQGELDPRDGWPAFVRAVRPLAFVAENVPALASRKFAAYVEQVITGPLITARRETAAVLSAPICR